MGNRAYVALECFESPYNERLIYYDYRKDEEEMLIRKAQEQFEANMARKKIKK